MGDIQRRIAVIGAGPIGLEAALYAATLGYEVTVFERGGIGAHVLDWGFVELFSPWSFNCSSLGMDSLSGFDPGWALPENGTLRTGRDYVENYLHPLSRLPSLRDRILTNTEVIALGREGLLKKDLPEDDGRSGHPFRVLVREESGSERVHLADVVIDATGTYGNHGWIGSGGIPAPGERESAPWIRYRLEDVLGRERSDYAGKRTLLIGVGFSAATTALAFEQLSGESPDTSLTWISAGEADVPYQLIPNDPLPSRSVLIASANRIASGSCDAISFYASARVESIRSSDDGKSRSVVFRQRNDVRAMEVDRIIGNVGYLPDNSIYRELQVHECYATSGPIELAASLLSGPSNSDCLAQTSAGPEVLKNPEPDFYIVGSKSYGRNSTFLIRMGLEQIRDIFTLITGNPELDLYSTCKLESQPKNT